MASDFGLVRTYGEATGGKILIGAVLDGILWGDTTYVSIIDDNQILPANINIINYPNPFNSKTIIKLDFLGSRNSSLKIFDILGRTIYTFWDNKFIYPGQYTLSWSGTDNMGRKVSSGVYFITFINELYSSKKSIVLIK